MRPAPLAIAVLLALVPAIAQAQTAQPAPATPTATAPTPELKGARKKMREACAGDIQKHCAAAPKGKGELQKCLQSHAAELTPTCTTARNEVKALAGRKS